MKSNNPIDTWDYQWTFTMWYYNGLAILPNVNLISNIGFGKDATHTIGESKMANMSRHEFVLNQHPSKIERDREADWYAFHRYFQPKPILIRVLNKLMRIIKGCIKK